jgi:hypothetical protein
MLTPEEIQRRLADRNLRTVAKAVDLHYNTVRAYARGEIKEPTYEAVRILSEYLTEGAAT